MIIRLATVDDKPRLIEMAARFIISSRYQQFMYPVPELLGKQVDVVLEHGAIWVADEFVVKKSMFDYGYPPMFEGEQMLIGMLAVLGPMPHAFTGKMIVEEVAWWVDPEFRHTSAGPRLMHNMECWVREKRADMVKMLAPSDSAVGDFYQKCGYQAVETAWVKVFS